MEKIGANSFLIWLFFAFINTVRGQDYSLDNISYKTISWNQFFEKLQADPNLIFFDIRTPGERADTSQYLQYNQGKIKGAIEVDYFDFKKSYPEYLKYKNDTFYIYCSHSQRTRRLAKQLTDSSFTKIININGGMSYLNTLSQNEAPLKQKYYETKLKYKLISPKKFIDAVKDKNVQLVDVRTDSVYQSLSNDDWENSFGVINKAIHIPYDKVNSNLNLLDKTKTIILFDNDGDLAPLAATELINKSYSTGVLLFGLNHLVSYSDKKDRKFLKSKYDLISPKDLLHLTQNENTVIIDVRTPSEFQNTDTTAWKNVGRLKNAINLPLSAISKEELEKFKGKKIVLYDFMMHEELFAFAKLMKQYGINNFSLLHGGINRVKWEIYNLGRNELSYLIN